MSRSDRILVLMMLVGGLLFCQIGVIPDPNTATSILTVREVIAIAGILMLFVSIIGLIGRHGVSKYD